MKNPTLVRIETFVVKDDYEKLKTVAAHAGYPVSVFLRSVLAVGLQEVLKTPEERAAGSSPKE